MPTPGKTLSSVESPSSSAEPLPLFRPEAIAALQQKFYGEIILIRPFSLMLLCWFALGISSAVLGFFFLGQYTERVRVPGVMTVSGVSSPQMAAELYVPGRWIGRLHAGSQISLRCDSCSPQFGRQVGTVLQIAEAPLAQSELAQSGLDLPGPVYKIAVSLQPKAAQITQANPSPQTGMRVEAEIPLGRKPLIKWFFERSGS
jgi:multidrug efflux pump subunit AcrA (membrane-fusion protein)